MEKLKKAIYGFGFIVGALSTVILFFGTYVTNKVMKEVEGPDWLQKHLKEIEKKLD